MLFYVMPSLSPKSLDEGNLDRVGRRSNQPNIEGPEPLSG